MAADYEHDSRCMPICLWVMLMMFWCGITHIGTLGSHQDCCYHQCLGNRCNMQMSLEDNNSQCHIISHNLAVHPYHTNMQAEFMQELSQASNEIEFDVKTEFDTSQCANNFSKLRKGATTTDTHDVDMCGEEVYDDDFSSWSIPLAGWSNKICFAPDTCNFQGNCDVDKSYSSLWAFPIGLKRLVWSEIMGPPNDRQQQKNWHVFYFCVCFATLFDILLLLMTQDGGTTRARTRNRLTHSFSLIKGPLIRVLQRVMYATALVTTFQGNYLIADAVQPFQINIAEQADCKQTKTVDYRRSFGVEVKAYIPKEEMVIKYRRTIGDGNCLWRAVAQFVPHKWYTLKRKVIQHMMQQATVENNQNMIESIRKLAKSNAWGNQHTIRGICSFLGVDVCVATRSAILVQPMMLP